MPTSPAVSPGLQAAYDGQYTDKVSAWRELAGKHKARNIVAVCAGRRFRDVLECGAGEGGVLMHLDAAGFAENLYAAEISDSGVRAIRARQLPSVRAVEKFDGYTLPFPDRRFDLAILSHVLEHVEHPRLLLRELRRVSRFQAIEVPLDYAPDIDRRTDHLLGYGHINVFTPSLLRFLLKSEGYSIVADHYSVQHPEVIQYSLYVNAGRRKTWRTELRRRSEAWLSAVRRRLTRAPHRNEFRYHAYTALCTHEGPGLRVLHTP